VFGDARQQSLAATSWEMGVLGWRFPGWQSGSGLSQLEGSAGKNKKDLINETFPPELESRKWRFGISSGRVCAWECERT
jgi:hypothetical protein